MQRNRLAAETSPYLQQHADNPVDWYPWGAPALELAKRENRPILLSVGYSACHWCHVMAHESFEDPATAAVMNELFVNIKVDREERPDLDRIYQIAQQLLTHGNGGWPLTMFLTPDTQQPFFGGTYFPKQARYGLPAFADLLRRVAAYYHEHGEEIRAQNSQLKAAFASLEPAAPSEAQLDASPLAAARLSLEQSFDSTFGGFTRAPKFPHPGSIERCLRHWYGSSDATSPDLKALYMATLTLTRMAEGGMYDQLGGGFSRYSVDEHWMIPHFEKMLYDNALLLAEYARAALATGEPLYRRVANETADWVLRDMHSPEGGFYSSLDADSEGHEGKFYVWDAGEVNSLLGAKRYPAFARRFGLDRTANFEGAWHLHAFTSLESIAAEGAQSPDELSAEIDASRALLLKNRNLRIWPGRDEKLLSAWNALMVKGLAIAARVLDRADLLQAAERCVDFLHHHLFRDGRLMATYKDGRAHLAAYLDDYAFLADALLELLQTRWRSKDLEFAVVLAEVLLEQFQDPRGGFFFTARDHEQLIHRNKSFTDDALPAGNGIAALVLQRLGYLLGEPRYLEAAERTLKAAWGGLKQYPQAHMSMLDALEEYLEPVEVLIIRGAAAQAQAWSKELSRLYAPRRLIFAIAADEPLPPGLAEKRAENATLAYLCRGSTCSAPMRDLDEVARGLKLRLD
ncbi:MAG TPA: thioredoxin domain-containing protein [Steroidobacteraceae bacterium]|jgi:hypothetical protein